MDHGVGTHRRHTQTGHKKGLREERIVMLGVAFRSAKKRVVQAKGAAWAKVQRWRSETVHVRTRGGLSLPGSTAVLLRIKRGEQKAKLTVFSRMPKPTLKQMPRLN